MIKIYRTALKHVMYIIERTFCGMNVKVFYVQLVLMYKEHPPPPPLSPLKLVSVQIYHRYRKMVQKCWTRVQ